MRRILVLAAKLLGGVAMGLPFAYVGAHIGLMTYTAAGGEFCVPFPSPALAKDCPIEHQWEGISEVLYGAAFGYALGIPVGVSVAGQLFGRKGSFWLTFLGSLLYVIIALPVTHPPLLAQGTVQGLLRASLIILPPVLATISFNISGSER
jgi:hypothetical protein